ncbi:hypothetical protein [Paenibacillus sanguinis]|nr:hypothetical protein [Paenibacillus sanguinis]
MIVVLVDAAAWCWNDSVWSTRLLGAVLVVTLMDAANLSFG